MTAPANDTKIDAIEMTLAHQDRQIQDLSDMVLKQGREIEALRRQLEMTQHKITDMQSGEGAPPANAKPPHY